MIPLSPDSDMPPVITQTTVPKPRRILVMRLGAIGDCLRVLRAMEHYVEGVQDPCAEG